MQESPVWYPGQIVLQYTAVTSKLLISISGWFMACTKPVNSKAVYTVQLSHLLTDDIRTVLKKTAPSIFQHWQQFQQIMKALDLLEQTKTTLGQQLLTTENLQRF